MRAVRSLVLVAALLSLSGTLIFADHALRFHPVVEQDDRPGVLSPPERILARIQADMERVAVGDSPWPLASGVARDPLEGLVPALDDLLRGKTLAAHDRLALVRAEAVARLGGPIPPKGRSLLADMVATLRLAEAALGAEPGRLRLPCPLVRGRRAAFEALAAEPGETAAVPVLSCPVPADRARDFAMMERLSARPEGFAALVVPPAVEPDAFPATPPGPPWDLAAAVRFMEVNPNAAEPVLRLAVLTGGPAAKLDLALFLLVFRDPGPARDGEIRSLAAALDGQAAYDGSDASLLPALRSAAEGYSYRIPCAVVLRRPALAEAAPSGCLLGRGRVEGFPESELAAFINHAPASGPGGRPPHYPVAAADAEAMDALLFHPRALLDWPDPGPDRPYQTWAYGSVDHYGRAAEMDRLYRPALDGMVRWLRGRGLDEAEAATAARKALFRLTPGSDCGHGPPPLSLRRAVMDGAPVAQLAPLLAVPADRWQPFADCAGTSPFDPLAHVAVLHPAMALLWRVAEEVSPEADPEGLRSLRQINLRTTRGRTPLMAAAEAGRPEAVAFLLDRGARVNAQDREGRTALMLAAARGSAACVRLLREAGADRFQADARGLQALDFLLGQGVPGGGGRLSTAERAELARLLY